jgi:hypothetical protein
MQGCKNEYTIGTRKNRFLMVVEFDSPHALVAE